MSTGLPRPTNYELFIKIKQTPLEYEGLALTVINKGINNGRN